MTIVTLRGYEVYHIFCTHLSEHRDLGGSWRMRTKHRPAYPVRDKMATRRIVSN